MASPSDWRYLYDAAASDNAVREESGSPFGKWHPHLSVNKPKPVGVDCRKLEWHRDHPLAVNGVVYRRGISVPLGQAYEAELAESWDRLAFRAGIDDDLFPEVEVTGQLRVMGDGGELFLSEPFSRGSPPLSAEIPIRNVRRLKISFERLHCHVEDDPDNWADPVEIFCDVIDPVVRRATADLPGPSGTPVLRGDLGVRAQAFDTPAPVWSVKAFDPSGSGTSEYLLGCWDDAVYRVDEALRIRWKYHAGGLPFSIKACDINSDGRAEIGVMALDPRGTLSVLDSDGGVLWKRAFGPGMHCADMGDIDGDGRVEVVVWDNLARLIVLDSDGQEKWQRDTVTNSFATSLALGDINDDGKLEILAGPCFNGLQAYSHEGDALWTRFDLGPTGFLAHVGSINFCRIDGRPVTVVSGRPGRVTALDEDGKTLWCYSHCGRGHDVAVSAVGRFTGGGGPEVAAVGHDGTFCVLSERGHLIGKSALPMPFLNLDAVPQRDPDTGTIRHVLLAASCGVRDARAYLVRLEEGRTGNVRDVLPSKEDGVVRNIDRVIDRVGAMRPRRERDSRQYHVFFGFRPFESLGCDCAGAEERLLRLKSFLTEQSTPGVRFEITPCGEGAPERLESPDPAARERAEWLLGRLEEHRIPFYAFFDHLGKMQLGIEAARRVLQLAPTACQGFEGAEQSGVVRPEIWHRWLPYMERMLSLAAEHGKKVVLRNNFGTWYNLPAHSECYDLLFGGRYAGTLVPMINANNPAQELSMSAVLAQWRSGAHAGWGVGSQHWNWNWWPVSLYNLCPPDNLLRTDFVAASLGATYFSVEGKFYDGRGGLRPEARRYRAFFYDMLRKGVFRPCGPERLTQLSDVLIEYDKPEGLENFVRLNGMIDGLSPEGSMVTQFRMQTSPDNYLPRLIYGVNRYFEGIFPETRYGIVGFLPSHARGTDWARKAWRTDGFRLLPREMDEEGNLSALRRDLEGSAKAMPFRAEGCFLSAQRHGDGYRVYLCDSEYLNPAGVETVLEINLPAPVDVRDVLEDRRINVDGNRVPIKIEAGVFRVFEVSCASGEHRPPR